MAEPRTAAPISTGETRQQGVDNAQWRALIKAGLGEKEFARAEAEGARAVIDAVKLQLRSPQEHIAPPNSIPLQRNQPPE